MSDTTRPTTHADPQPSIPTADHGDDTAEDATLAPPAQTDRADEPGERAGSERVVAAADELTREPQPLVWADSGEPVGATVQLIPPYVRRVSRTSRGEMVTGVRVSCRDGYGRRVHVDLAAAQTRMASVWDDETTTPVALLQFVPGNHPSSDDEQPADRQQDQLDGAASGHAGSVVVTTGPFDYFHSREITTVRYPNLETALVALTMLLDA